MASQLAKPCFPPRSDQAPTISFKYFGPFVKHLIIGGPHLERDSVINFLVACHNIGNLALWTHITTREFLPALEVLSLNRLSTNLAGLSFEDLTSSTFRNITHLDISPGLDDTEPYNCWPEWRAFSHLTFLTHLAINDLMGNFDEIIRNLLRDCQHLQILLIIEVMNSTLDLKNVPFSDPRLILMKIERYMLEDWVEGAKGNEDIWRCAEEISRAKQGNLPRYLNTSSLSRGILDGFLKNIDHRIWFTRHGYREELYKRCGYPKGS